MKTRTRSKLGAFNPADLLRYGFEYLNWTYKSDATKTAEFQDAAKFEQDVLRSLPLWEQGMNAIEAEYPPNFDYFVDPGFWTRYQAAVVDLDEWVNKAKPILDRLHQSIEEMVRKGIAEGKLPADTLDRLNAELERRSRGLSAVPVLAIAGIIAAAITVIGIAFFIAFFYPSWVRAWADADVIRQEGAARVQAYLAVEAERLEAARKYNEARLAQGQAPVPVPFVDLPQNDNGRGGSGAGKFGAGAVVGVIIGGGLLYLAANALSGKGGGK